MTTTKKTLKDPSKMTWQEAYDELAYNIHHMPRDVHERRAMVRRNHELTITIDRLGQQFLKEIA